MQKRLIHVLLVKTAENETESIQRLLADVRSAHFEPAYAHTLEKAVGLLETNHYDAILLDPDLVDSKGIATFEKIQQHADGLPVLILSDRDDETLSMLTVQKGAQDYLVTGRLDGDCLARAIIYAIERRRLSEESLRANRRVLEQQKSVLEEERLKVLLQMAGATGHELNQPLTALLGFSELLKMNLNNPELIANYADKIGLAGRQLYDIVSKIQQIHDYEHQHHFGDRDLFYTEQKLNVLAVDDSDDDYAKLKSLLENEKMIRLSRATTLEEATQALKRKTFHMVLLEYRLPDGNGLDFLDRLEKEGARPPVVFLTNRGNEMVASKAIKAGAYDYITKERLDREALLKCIGNTQEKARLKNEIDRAQRELAEMSIKDGLTGIFNRRYMDEVVEREMSRARRYQADLSCLLIDLDFFKRVNDSFGHAFGDYVLKTFCKYLQQETRQSDWCFRYGGEEFIVLLPEIDVFRARQVAEKIRKRCDSTVYEDGMNSIRVTVSIGIAALKHHQPIDANELFAFVDDALYQAKAEGRNRVKVFQKDPLGSPLDGRPRVQTDLQFLKHGLMAVLEKTKKASIASLELLARDVDLSPFRNHNRRVLQYLDRLGERLGFPPEIIQTFKRSATLHDCFRILLGEKIITKREILGEDERNHIQNHPYMLAELTELFDFFSDEREVLICHHEHFNGSGYPEGLKGDQIPLGARIFALVEAFVAMTSERPYRDLRTPEKVIKELVENSGKQFDPWLVDVFLDMIDEYGLMDVSRETIKRAKTEVKEIMNSNFRGR